jgi:hypothetical protein
MNYLILDLLILPFAVWRISNMLADTEQSGLFNSLDWIRRKAGVKFNPDGTFYAKSGSIGDGLTCVLCNSIWLGILFALLLIVNQEVTFFVSLPFALSALAIFIQKGFSNGNN